MTTPPIEVAASQRVRRLRDGRSVVRALRSGRRVGGRFVTVHFGLRADLTRDHAEAADFGVTVATASRLAVVASRKVGSAVVRNRAKRLLREAARGAPWPAGYDIVLVARPTCGDASLLTLRADLAALVERSPRAVCRQ